MAPDINDLLVSGIPSCVELADNLIHAKQNFEQGKITESEYLDLLQDLSRLDRIKDDMDKLNAYMTIEQIVYIIDQFRHWAPLI